MPRVMSELVPAPAITAGIVKTPVPMMLPMTSAVADVSPSERARWSSGPGEGAPAVGGALTAGSIVAVMVTS